MADRSSAVFEEPYIHIATGVKGDISKGHKDYIFGRLTWEMTNWFASEIIGWLIIRALDVHAWFQVIHFQFECTQHTPGGCILQLNYKLVVQGRSGKTITIEGICEDVRNPRANTQEMNASRQQVLEDLWAALVAAGANSLKSIS